MNENVTIYKVMPERKSPRDVELGAHLQLGERLQGALDRSHGEFTVKDLLLLFSKNELQVWAAVTSDKIVGLASTQVIEYPQVKALRVVTVSGANIEDWVGQLIETFEMFCREQGLSRIEAVGRRGFVRLLKPFGFKEAYTVVVKEVQHV